MCSLKNFPFQMNSFQTNEGPCINTLEYQPVDLTSEKPTSSDSGKATASCFTIHTLELNDNVNYFLLENIP